MKVNLQTIIHGIEMANDSSEQFYHIPTETIVSVFDFDDDKEEIVNDIEENGENYLRIPDQYDIDEYDIMEQFIRGLEDVIIQNKIVKVIRGKGAFRRFKYYIHELNIADQWYQFLDKTFREKAIEWCKENNLEYSEN